MTYFSLITEDVHFVRGVQAIWEISCIMKKYTNEQEHGLLNDEI